MCRDRGGWKDGFKAVEKETRCALEEAFGDGTEIIHKHLTDDGEGSVVRQWSGH